MVYADLHVHTVQSDGTLTLETLPAAAREAGVSVVAVTDHDRVHPGLDAPVVALDGVTVIRGIELRVEAADGQRVDVLGYGVEETDALSREVERIQADRLSRGRRIVERVEDYLDVDLDVEPRPGLGRPHVARAIADHPDVEYDYEGAFEHLIGDDGPCFVARDVPSFETGRDILTEACSVVALAHPLRYPDPAAALELAPALRTPDARAGVERWYPYSEHHLHDGPVDLGMVDDVLAASDLLATGGSDAHDEVLGRAGLTREAYEEVSAYLST